MYKIIDTPYIIFPYGLYCDGYFYGNIGEQDMSFQSVPKAKWPDLPVNLRRHQQGMSGDKYAWMALNLCGRSLSDDAMYPAAVPYCELEGVTYEDWDYHMKDLIHGK